MAAEIAYTVDNGEKLANETFGPNNIRRRTSGDDPATPPGAPPRTRASRRGP